MICYTSAMLPYEIGRRPVSFEVGGQTYSNQELIHRGRELYQSVAQAFSPNPYNPFDPSPSQEGVFPGFSTRIITACFLPKAGDVITLAPPQFEDKPAYPYSLYTGEYAPYLNIVISRMTQAGVPLVRDRIMDRWRRRLDQSLAIELKLPGMHTVFGALSLNGSLTQLPPSYGPGRERRDIDRITQNTIAETHSLFSLVDTLFKEDRLEPIDEEPNEE